MRVLLSLIHISVLWVGALGQEGAYALGEALNGTVNPSGHLVDTWAADAASAPAAANLGDYTRCV